MAETKEPSSHSSGGGQRQQQQQQAGSSPAPMAGLGLHLEAHWSQWGLEWRPAAARSEEVEAEEFQETDERENLNHTISELTKQKDTWVSLIPGTDVF